MTLETYYTPNYQLKKYKPRDLSDKQIKFCEAYLAEGFATTAARIAGYSSPARAGAYLLSCQRIKDYLDKQEPRYAKVPITIEHKMERLAHVMNEFIPNEGELVPNTVKVGITAIQELNKMQGHYAPEKSINMNVNTDITEAKELMNRLEKEHKSEY